MSDTSWSTSVHQASGASGRRPAQGADTELLDAVLPLIYGWLPRQRWFAGKGRPIADIRVASSTRMADHSEDSAGLLHVLLRVRHVAAEAATGRAAAADQPACYQLLLGTRSTAPAVPAEAVIGRIDAGPHDGLLVYDALHDPEAAAHTLRSLSSRAEFGALRCRRVPGASIPTGLQPRVGTAEQSNTSVVYGDSLILKVFRQLSAGVNPDLELTVALATEGSSRVPAPLGWIETDWPRTEPTGAGLTGAGPTGAGPAGAGSAGAGSAGAELTAAGPRAEGLGTEGLGTEGEQVTLGLLQRFLPGSADGWELALASVPEGDFTAESFLLGSATAEVHTALARALPVVTLGQPQIDALAEGMARRLDTAAAAVPELRPHREALLSAFDDLTGLGREGRTLPAQRIHGDLHLGQVLRTTDGWVLLDFEGEPAQPIAERRRPQPAVRDVAAMLRSFDYAARHHGASPRAEEWAERNRSAFCAGYAAVGDQDPAAEHVLMRAFETDKAVYEVLYEARHRPSWLPIPMSAIERLAQGRDR